MSKRTNDMDCDNKIKKQKIGFTAGKHKNDEIDAEILHRQIKMSDIIQLDLPMDEYIWFSEYFRILHYAQPHTEDRFRIANMVYKKYMSLKNVDTEKLNKIRIESGAEHDIITKILNSHHPDSVKAILYKKYKRYYDSGSESSDEFTKLIDWIENILDMPVTIGMDDNFNINTVLNKLWKSLNNNTYGLQHVKEKVMESMCAKLLDPEKKGRVITLVGPPGVGKTSIALSIANALDMPFDQISFGSVKDSTILTGHSSTYVGSVPGLFSTILLKSKRLDTVVLLDEIDKIQPNTLEGRSVSSVLLHVLDRSQNNKFRDLYMPEIYLDLSKIFFICAANYVDDIDPVLLDRMTLIQIDGYNISEKVEIMKNHLFPRVRHELGFDEKDILFGDNEMEYLVANYTEDKPGMRDCEKKLYQICERLALNKHVKEIKFSFRLDNLKFPVKMTNNMIDNLMK